MEAWHEEFGCDEIAATGTNSLRTRTLETCMKA
jgi:hypothetical protein